MALAIQPFISIIIPVLNSQNTIGDCLKSITAQDYPKDKLEILIADGGSTDATIDIIKSFSLTNLKILPNPLKTGEAGKAVGAKAARADIAAFIDSDNILPSENWLKRMIEPFCDP
ncbi:MAG: glycosyltransferase, partial [Candidatus Omnitrophica bacterium]|nr:glycosyltransferase [Candidatus Omnitrophota bacterium]